MVRLKAPPSSRGCSVLIDFNSTMVRLKDIDGLDIPFDSLFQFHYGTIKSANPIGSERFL